MQMDDVGADQRVPQRAGERRRERQAAQDLGLEVAHRHAVALAFGWHDGYWR